MKAKIVDGKLIVEELSTSDEDADWLKMIPGAREGEDRAHREALKLERARQKKARKGKMK